MRHQPPPLAVGPLLGQPDFGQAAVLTAAVADQRTGELDHLPQCFQYQVPGEAADAPSPAAAAAATARTGGDTTAAAVHAADQPAEFECCRLAIDVPVAAVTASHVTACCPAQDFALVASCAPALRSALGPAPAASHQRAAAVAAAASSWKLSRQLLAAVRAAVELPGSRQTPEAARSIAEGPAEHLRTLWAPIQHTET